MQVARRIKAFVCFSAFLASIGGFVALPAPSEAAPAKSSSAQSAKSKPAAKPAAQRSAAVSAKATPPARPVARPVSNVSRQKATPAKASRLATSRKIVGPRSKSGNIKSAKLQVASARWGGISCVPFARAATGMAVKGNAHAWWDDAAGTYQRGARPEAGSVLNFRATSRMRLGHVAVVSRVIDSRTVEIDHANWAGPGSRKGMVARGVPVIDVSERNDWSAVRVALSRGGEFGSVYPTYGFIYDRPDNGIMVANTLAKPGRMTTEVAEAPMSRAGWTTQVSTARVDAPVRSLR